MAVAVKRGEQRIKRKARIRKKISGTADRPRLNVFRSARYIYAQLIDDDSGRTLAAGSSLEKDLKARLKSTSNKDAAKEVGKVVGERAKKAKIESVVFDRNGLLYHGRIQAVAEGAREAGLKF